MLDLDLWEIEFVHRLTDKGIPCDIHCILKCLELICCKAWNFRILSLIDSAAKELMFEMRY